MLFQVGSHPIRGIRISKNNLYCVAMSGNHNPGIRGEESVLLHGDDVVPFSRIIERLVVTTRAVGRGDVLQIARDTVNRISVQFRI